MNTDIDAVAKVRSLALSLQAIVKNVKRAVSKGRRSRAHSLYHARRSLGRISEDVLKIRPVFESCGGSYKWISKMYELLARAKRRQVNAVLGKSRKLLETLSLFSAKLEAYLSCARRAIAA